MAIGKTDVVLYNMNSPSLHLLIVQGTLIFLDELDLELNCTYIMVKGDEDGTRLARFQVGTEDKPFQHKATITLEGNRRIHEIPIYGGKVLGVRFAELDLHGVDRQVTWTRLAASAPRGADFIDLQEPTDWVIGDEIVVAPTDYYYNQHEQRTIRNVTHEGSRIHLDEPLYYDHWGSGYTVEAPGTPHHGVELPMAAEVGLLTRNVVVQGDDQTYDIQFGATIFMHSLGDETLYGRLTNVEVKNAGQGFFLGRYAVHYHMVGSVQGSFVKKSTIHHSFNRAVAVHGVEDLLLENNVVFDIRGQTFFLEDGVEMGNVITGNLAIGTKPLFSLLVVDQTPASYWVVNPGNYLTDNVAAGNSNFGFWYRPLDHPDGLSETSLYCPDEVPLGAFSNNIAHSTGMYGLKLQDMTPRLGGFYCTSSTPVQAMFDGFLGYKQAMAGIWMSCTDGDVCDTLSHVTLNDFTFIDSRNAAFEYWAYGDGMLISNALAVGISPNNATIHTRFFDIQSFEGPADAYSGGNTVGNLMEENCEWTIPEVVGDARLKSCGTNQSGDGWTTIHKAVVNRTIAGTCDASNVCIASDEDELDFIVDSYGTNATERTTGACIDLEVGDACAYEREEFADVAWMVMDL